MESLRVPVPDASGDMVKTRFVTFLQTFVGEEEDAETTTTQQRCVELIGMMSLKKNFHQLNFVWKRRLFSDYRSQLAAMIENSKSTVYVNFQHILEV